MITSITDLAFLHDDEDTVDKQLFCDYWSAYQTDYDIAFCAAEAWLVEHGLDRQTLDNEEFTKLVNGQYDDMEYIDCHQDVGGWLDDRDY